MNKLEFNTNIIKYGDECHVPENDLVECSGRFILRNVSKSRIEIESKYGVEYLWLTPRNAKDIGVIFIDKSKWIRWNESENHFIEFW